MKKASKFYPNYFTIPALVIFIIFYEIPLIAGFVLSFTDWNIMRMFEPKFNGLKNFVYLFQDEYFRLAIVNTVVYAIFTTIFITLIGLGLALLLNTKLYGRNVFRTIFYLPAVLSFIVVGIMFTSLLRMDNGLVNQILRVVGLESWAIDWLGNSTTAFASVIVMQIWKWSGFAMIIFLAGLQGIPKDYIEAAEIDGASKLAQFKHIILPLLAPAFTVVLTQNIIGGFKVFEQVFVLTSGGPGNSTQVLGTYIYKEFSKGNLGRSTAMGLMLFITISILALVVNKTLKKREVEL